MDATNKNPNYYIASGAVNVEPASITKGDSSNACVFMSVRSGSTITFFNERLFNYERIAGNPAENARINDYLKTKIAFGVDGLYRRWYLKAYDTYLGEGSSSYIYYLYARIDIINDEAMLVLSRDAVKPRLVWSGCVEYEQADGTLRPEVQVSEGEGEAPLPSSLEDYGTLQYVWVPLGNPYANANSKPGLCWLDTESPRVVHGFDTGSLGTDEHRYNETESKSVWFSASTATKTITMLGGWVFSAMRSLTYAFRKRTATDTTFIELESILTRGDDVTDALASEGQGSYVDDKSTVTSGFLFKPFYNWLRTKFIYRDAPKNDVQEITGSLSLVGNMGIGGGATIGGALDVTGQTTVSDLVSQSISNAGKITTQDLKVLGTAEFFELVIQKIKASGGATLYTPADGFKVEQMAYVDTSVLTFDGDIAVMAPGGFPQGSIIPASSIQSVYESGHLAILLLWRKTNASGDSVDNMWQAGDQAICKNFRGAQEGASSGVSNKSWWSLVIAAGSTSGTVDFATFGDIVGSGLDSAQANYILIAAPDVQHNNSRQNADVPLLDGTLINSDLTAVVAPGDGIAMLGHRPTNAELEASAGMTLRQLREQDWYRRGNAIYISAYSGIDEGFSDGMHTVRALVAPFYAQYRGIMDFNLSKYRRTFFDAHGANIVGDVVIETENGDETLDEYLDGARIRVDVNPTQVLMTTRDRVQEQEFQVSVYAGNDKLEFTKDETLASSSPRYFCVSPITLGSGYGVTLEPYDGASELSRGNAVMKVTVPAGAQLDGVFPFRVFMPARAYETEKSVSFTTVYIPNGTVRLESYNEMDMLLTDNTGAWNVPQSVQTEVHMFVGDDDTAIADISYESDDTYIWTPSLASGDSVAGPNDILKVTHTMMSGNKGAVVKVDTIAGKRLTTPAHIIISARVNDVVRKTVFTVSPSLGSAVYQLQVDSNSILVGKDESLSVSSVTAKVVKTDASGSRNVDISDEALTVYTVLDKEATLGNCQELDAQRTGTSFTCSTFTKDSSRVSFVLVRGMGGNRVILDAETVPVLRDGQNGTDSTEIVVNPSSLVFDTDNHGEVADAKEADISVYYEGVQLTNREFNISVKAYNCTVNTPSNVGTYQKRISLKPVPGTDKVTIDEQTFRFPASAGSVVCTITVVSSGKQYSVTIPYVVNIHSFYKYIVDRDDMFQRVIGQVSKDYEGIKKEYSSITQNYDNILLKVGTVESGIDGVVTGLSETGIDIEQRKITMKADQFELLNNNDERSLYADDKGNVEFAGTLKTKFGVFGGLTRSDTTVITADNIMDYVEWKPLLLPPPNADTYARYCGWVLNLEKCGSNVVFYSWDGEEISSGAYVVKPVLENYGLIQSVLEQEFNKLSSDEKTDYSAPYDMVFVQLPFYAQTVKFHADGEQECSFQEYVSDYLDAPNGTDVMLYRQAKQYVGNHISLVNATKGDDDPLHTRDIYVCLIGDINNESIQNQRCDGVETITPGYEYCGEIKASGWRAEQGNSFTYTSCGVVRTYKATVFGSYKWKSVYGLLT